LATELVGRQVAAIVTVPDKLLALADEVIE
jgi:hypothetical protein